MILNITQHPATPEQIAAGVVDLPADKRAALCSLLTFDALAAKADAEIARLAGENSVLRGLLHESLLFVTQSIFGETEHEVVLERFADRIKAAIYGRQDGGLFDGGEK